MENYKRSESNVDRERGIRYFPIGLFASVMGFAGVTIAIRQAENLYALNNVLSTIFLAITTLLFLLNGGIFLYRMFLHREEVKKDFNHPVKMNFFAAISLSMLLLAAAYFELSKAMSLTLWIAGSIMQMSLTLVILSKLIWHHQFQIGQFNPSWFIPIVGNIVVPIAGTLLNMPKEINWMFFGFGALFSIIYMTIFFNRSVFHPPLPAKLLPTYFILMAPPAIGFVSYIKISESADTFAYILYGIAFFIGLFLLFQVKRFMSIPFFVSWWAFLFPSAAMTIATVQLYFESGHVVYRWFFTVQLIGLIGLVLYLAWKTIELAMKRSLCLKE